MYVCYKIRDAKVTAQVAILFLDTIVFVSNILRARELCTLFEIQPSDTSQ